MGKITYFKVEVSPERQKVIDEVQERCIQETMERLGLTREQVEEQAKYLG